MMDKRDFVHHCVLHREMDPETAVRLWEKTEAELLKGWRLNKMGTGEMLASLHDLLASMSPSTRRTLGACLKEAYPEFR